LIKAKELAQATLAEAEKRKEQSQNTEKVLEVEDLDEECNEEHITLIQELEEVEDGSILTKILEVEVMDRKGKKKIIAQ
jgi:hypothetical protein